MNRLAWIRLPVRTGLFLAILISGCSVPQRPSPAPAPPPDATIVPPSRELAAETPAGPVRELLHKAAEQYASGDLDGAAATLERAIRIAPSEPLVWQRLALVRLDQGDWEQAETLALRSSGLAPGNVGLRKVNQDIIVEAREAAAGGR